MVAFNVLVAVALAYVAFLFAVAFFAERRAAQGFGGWLYSPMLRDQGWNLLRST